MAALKEVAREYASEIRDGIGWVIVYRTGRSWHALTVWSDPGNNEWAVSYTHLTLPTT